MTIQSYLEFVRENREREAGRIDRVRPIGIGKTGCRWKVLAVEGTCEVEALIGEREVLAALSTDRPIPIRFRVRRVGEGLLRGPRRGV